MAKKAAKKKIVSKKTPPKAHEKSKPSVLIDTRVIYCGDNLEQLKKLPENSVDLIYIDPPFTAIAIMRCSGVRRRKNALLPTVMHRRMHISNLCGHSVLNCTGK